MNTRLELPTNRELELERSLNLSQHELRTLKFTICETVGGTVEGFPTAPINYLQRLRQLVEIEKCSNSLLDYLRKNAGCNAEWPIDLVARDEESARKLASLLDDIERVSKPL